jgi:hypothetical protein
MIVIGHAVTGRARRRVLENPISRVCLDCVNLIRMFEHRLDPLESGNVASSYVFSNFFQVVQNQHLAIIRRWGPYVARKGDQNSLSQMRVCNSALTPADGRPSALQMAAKILFSIGLLLTRRKRGSGSR